MVNDDCNENLRIAIQALRDIQKLGRDDRVGKVLLLMTADQALHAIQAGFGKR